MTLAPDQLQALAAGIVGVFAGSFFLIRLWVFGKNLIR